MNMEIRYTVECFLDGFGPLRVCQYATITEAKNKFRSEKFVLKHMIMEALEMKDEDYLQSLKKQTVQLNKISITYNADGEMVRHHAVKIERYGEALDWDELRAKLSS